MVGCFGKTYFSHLVLLYSSYGSIEIKDLNSKYFKILLYIKRAVKETGLSLKAINSYHHHLVDQFKLGGDILNFTLNCPQNEVYTGENCESKHANKILHFDIGVNQKGVQKWHFKISRKNYL